MSEHNQMPVAGTFCWNELSTNDPDAAKTFYTELLGWQLKESDATGMKYTEIVASNGEHIGGIYQAGPECSGGEARPHWMSYVAVEDVDARAARVEALGGKLRVPPTDIPNVGRFCVISDPTGATLSLLTLKGASS